MKEGKEEKPPPPLFPRLHVKDRDKGGGPRAPPRNKMALYEHFSIPTLISSSNSISGSPSSLPLSFSNPTITSLSSASSTQLKGSNSKNLIPGQHVKNQNINNLEVSKTSMDCTKKPASHLLPRERSALKHTVVSSGQDHHYSSVNDLANVSDLNAQLHQGNRSGVQQESAACGNGVLNESKKLEKRNNLSIFRRDSCSSPPLRDNHRSPNEVESGNSFHEDNACRLFKIVDADRNDEISEASMVDSISGMEITTDEVVDLIGQQHFWKARRVIFNQQRVFARQVFELHRLIEVQRLIAATPDMLLEDYPVVNTISEKASLAKKPPTDIVLEAETTKPKNDSKNQNQSPKHADENTAEKHHSLDGTKDVPTHSSSLTQRSSPCTYPGNVPLAAPISTNNKAGLWSFHPPLGNQWLVPVMSPSEGLVYKPCPGPFPPNAGGFMPPIYGGCTPISLPPFEASFPNPAFGALATRSPATGVHSVTYPIAHIFSPPPTYFPSYCMPPALNPVNSATVSNLTALPGAQMLRQTEQFSDVELNGYIFSQHQNELWKHRNEASSSSVGNLRASKDSQVSTASNLSIRMQESNASERSNALPIFSVDLVHNGHQTQAQAQTRQASVIRVVPHNARSATESAARIFQCIQQERQQSDTTL